MSHLICHRLTRQALMSMYSVLFHFALIFISLEIFNFVNKKCNKAHLIGIATKFIGLCQRQYAGNRMNHAIGQRIDGSVLRKKKQQCSSPLFHSFPWFAVLLHA